MLSIQTKTVLIIALLGVLIAAGGMIYGILLIRNRTEIILEDNLRLVSSAASKLVSEGLDNVGSSLDETVKTIRASREDRIQRNLLKEGVSRRFQSLTLIDRKGPTRSYGACVTRSEEKESAYVQETFQGKPTVNAGRYGLDESLLLRITRQVDENRILVGMLPVSLVQNQLSSLGTMYGGDLFLLDAEGTVIAGTDPRESYPDADGYHETCLRSVFSRMIEGEEGVLRHRDRGMDQIFAFSPVTGTDHWSLGVAFSLSPIPTSRFFLIFLIFLGIFLLLGIGGGILCIVNSRKGPE
jgi:hypothetical protein